MELAIERGSAATFVLPYERSIQFRCTGAGDEWVLELDRLHGYGTDDAATALVRAVVLGAIAGGLRDEVIEAMRDGLAEQVKATREAADRADLLGSKAWADRQRARIAARRLPEQRESAS